MTTISPALLAELQHIVGEAHAFTDPDLLATYETDWTRRYTGPAACVVRPGSTSEVAAVLSVCHSNSISVVPQGGNTGLVGGGVPRGGEVVVSLTRLTDIVDFDSVSSELTVGAGVTLATLQDFARERGRSFGVDLASRASATIGGMIATNAGGIRVLRHGNMRAQVVGLEAVRADGAILNRLPGLHKDNTGYDLPGLIAGSEGTLALITRARLRLIPTFEARAVALLAVDSIDAALAMLPALRRLGSLDAIEVFFREGLELVLHHTRLPQPFAHTYPAYLLVECAAQVDPTAELAATLADATFEDSAIATTRPDRERLWSYRERHTEAISAEGVPHKLDIALPLPCLSDFVPGVRDRLARSVPEARAILFGHLADGNLHVNVLGLVADDDRATDVVLRYVAELGGSISAEHGIGVAKTRWLSLTRSPEDIATMSAIKSAFDPKRILNPGVIFPAGEV